MIAKSPSKRIRTSSATSPLIVTGCAVSLRNSALSSSEPSGFEIMKSSAKISSKRFTSPFCTDAVKSRFRAVSVSRSRCAFAFVCMAISSGVRRFLVQLRNEALIFDPQEFIPRGAFSRSVRPVCRWESARPCRRAGRDRASEKRLTSIASFAHIGRHDGRGPGDSFGRGGLREDRVSSDVHPVILLCGDMAHLAVGPVVGCHVLLRILRLEQGPPPPISLQVVLGDL